jgi:hypothetical protein
MVIQLQGSSVWWAKNIIVETGGIPWHTGFEQKTGATASGPSNYKATKVYNCAEGYKGEANAYNSNITDWTFVGCTTDYVLSDVQALV